METDKAPPFQFIDQTIPVPQSDRLHENINGDEESKVVQDLRIIMAMAMANVLADIFEQEDRLDKNPYLADPEDDKSDYITELDFGEGFETKCRITYEGLLHFDNHIIPQILKDCRHRVGEFLGNLLGVQLF